MKKVLFFATIVAMSMAVAMPAQAQSRKDKKEAAKAQWEMEQQQQREEAELKHQMRMDSLRNVQRQNEEIEAEAKAARLRAEEERRAAEEEAKARIKKEEEELAAQEKDVDEPCTEAGSSETYIRARGIGESLQQQMARTKAQTVAVRDLGAKIGTAVQALIKHYADEETISVMTDDASADGMSLEEKIQTMTKQKVDQNLSFSTFCEKTRSYMKNNKKIFKCYMTIQAGKDDIMKPIYNEIQKEAKSKLALDYEKFSEEFDKEFNKAE